MTDRILIWLEHDGKQIPVECCSLDLVEGKAISSLRARYQSSDGRSVISLGISTSTPRPAFRETLRGLFLSGTFYRHLDSLSVREKLTRCVSLAAQSLRGSPRT